MWFFVENPFLTYKKRKLNLELRSCFVKTLNMKNFSKFSKSSLTLLMKYLPQTPIRFHINNSVTEQTMEIYFLNLCDDGRAS